MTKAHLHQRSRLCRIAASLGLLLTLLCCNEVAVVHEVDGVSTAYHVDAEEGDDANSGLTPEEAWRTVARVNAAELLPGDHVLFRAGQMWRELLRIGDSGSEGSPIVYASYGDGLRPVLRAAQELENWQSTAHPSIQRAILSFEPTQVFQGSLRLSRETYLDAAEALALAPGSWTFDDTAQELWVRSSEEAGDAPIEVSVHDVCLGGNNRDYIVVDGLAFERARQDGLSTAGGRGWVVRNVRATDNFRYGVGAGTGSRDLLFEGSVAQSNGVGFGGHDVSHLTIRGNASVGSSERIDSDGIAVSWSDHVIIEENRSGGNSQGGSADGIQAAGCQDVVIRRNFVYDVENGGIILTLSSEPSTGRVYGNVITGGKAGIILMIDEGLTQVFNNSIWNDREGGIKLSNVRGDATLQITNNAIHTTGRCLLVPSPWDELVDSDHNVLYSSGEIFASWGGTMYFDGESFRSSTGSDGYSFIAQPGFINPAEGDLRVLASSPCIDVGIQTDLSVDFFGSDVPLDGNGDDTPVLDVGAIEFDG